MQKKKFRLLQTTVGRMILVLILLVIPLNVLTIVLVQMNSAREQQRMEEEVQKTMEVAVANVSDDLDRAYKKELYLSFSDSDFAVLERSMTGKVNSVIAEATAGVNNKVKEVGQDYDEIDLVYFYFPENDYFIANGSPGINRSSYKEYILTLDEETNLDYGAQWFVDELEEVPILVSFSKWRNAQFGALINLNNLESHINLPTSEGQWIFFVSDDGKIYSSSANTLLEESGLTYDEIIKSNKYEVYETPINDCGVKLIQVQRSTLFWNNLSVATRVLTVASVIFTLLALPMLLYFTNRLVNKPINRLIKAIDRIEQGDLEYRIKEGDENLEFEQINRSFNNMMEQVQSLKIDVYEREIEKKDIMMQYLSQQIQPHFVLNALNILYSYEPEEYELSQKMILHISKYFRYIVNTSELFVTLAMEMNHIRNYFEIQKARFPGLFYSIVEYDESLRNALIPPLLVQSFAENSIKHSLKVGNKITIFLITDIIEGEDQEKKMRIRLADTGEGLPDDVLAEIAAFQQTGEKQAHLGVGIQNAIERLRYLYGDISSIRFWNETNTHGTNIEIILPIYFSQKEIRENA